MHSSRSARALARIALLLAPTLAAAASAGGGAGEPASVLREHQGRWLGALALPNGRVVKSGLDIFTRADGSTWASYASPDRAAFDIPVTRIRDDGRRVELELPFASLALSFVGDHFDGEWKQNGESTPLALRKVDDFPRTRRPQDPATPLPYVEQALAIASVDGVTLGATLSVPRGAKRFDLAILVPGSGPQTRDEEGGGHRTFAVLADQLARRGIAVLRYDKRGVSRSTGDYASHTQSDLVADLEAVVRTLRVHERVRRVGLIGHSEGPAIAAAVAARHPQWVDFVVSLAGVGLAGTDMILLQDRAYAGDQGADAGEAAALMRHARRWYETIVAQADPVAREAALKALVDSLPADDRALVEKYHMNVGSLSLEEAREPALRDLLIADPRRDWRAVRCPVLALNGALDHQVPPESLDGIVAALRAGGNAHVDAAVLPALNHMFQTARTGGEDEYATIDETLAPVVVERIAAFVRRRRGAS